MKKFARIFDIAIRLSILSFVLVYFITEGQCRAYGETVDKVGPSSIVGPKTNVIFITIDNMRADTLEGGGSEDVETKAIHELMLHGATFKQFIHSTPLALPNVASLLTGLIPPHHGVRDSSHFQLLASFETLPKLFKASGYKTFAFLGSKQYSNRFGFGQGFDEYDDSLTEKDRVQLEAFPTYLPAARLNKKVFSRLDQEAASQKKPFFLWLHYSDIAATFSLNNKRIEIGNYQGAVKRIDESILGLIEYLKKNNLYQNTLIVLTATKPQNLGEHKEQLNGLNLYDVDLKAPLIISHPGLFAKPLTIDQLATSVDLYPTLMGLLYFQGSRPKDGKDLSGLLRGRSEEARPESETRAVYLETFVPVESYGLDLAKGIRTQDFKYVRASGPYGEQLFNIQENPLELRTSSPVGDADSKKYRDLLSKFEKTFDPEITKNAYLGSWFQGEKTAKLFRDLTGLSPDNEFLKLIQSSFETRSLGKGEILGLEPLEGSQSENYREVFARVKQRFQNNPMSRTDHFQLAQLYSVNPNYEKDALTEAYLVLKQDPLYWPTYEFIASEYRRVKIPQKLDDLWRFAALANPEWIQPYVELMVSYLKKNAEKELHELLKSVTTSDPAKAASLWAVAAEYRFNELKWKDAVSFADEALKINKDHVPALVIRSVAKIRSGAIEEGLKGMSQVSLLDQDSFAKWLYREVLYQAVEKKDVATADKLVKYFKEKAGTHFLSALAEANVAEIEKREKDALNKLKTFLKTVEDPTIKTVLFEQIANLYGRMNNSKESKAYYKKALDLNPYLPGSANNYAWIIGAEGKDVKEGLRWIYKALSREPENPIFLDTLAALYAKDGKIKYALETQRDAVRLAPQEASLIERLKKYQTALAVGKQNQENLIQTLDERAKKNLAIQERESQRLLQELDKREAQKSKNGKLASAKLTRQEEALRLIDELDRREAEKKAQSEGQNAKK